MKKIKFHDRKKQITQKISLSATFTALVTLDCDRNLCRGASDFIRDLPECDGSRAR